MAAPTAAEIAESQADVATFEDGNVMRFAKPPEVDAMTWSKMRSWSQRHPGIAKDLQNFYKSPEAMREWLQMQAVVDHYQMKIQDGDEEALSGLHALTVNDELAPILDEVRKNGLEAAMKHWDDKELMLKISRTMGGLPASLEPILDRIGERPVSLYEAAKKGSVDSISEHIGRHASIDMQDSKGITPLGYAAGANDSIAAAKLLLETGANPHCVDNRNSNALHYAAGYGREEVVEYLLKLGVSANQVDANGQTPITLARSRRQQACVDIMEAYVRGKP